MAWESFPVSFLEISIDNNMTTGYSWSNSFNHNPLENELPFTKGSNLFFRTETLYEDANYLVQCTWNNNTLNSTFEVIEKPNTTLARYSMSETAYDASGNREGFFGIEFLIDNTNQLGCFGNCGIIPRRATLYDCYSQFQGYYASNALYQFLMQLPPIVVYNWSSVPSISGKKGTLSLTQILNINDGEPVENITNRGNLDFSKKTKVNTLVNSAYEPTYKEDATKATVEYEIPEAEYQYTKLVYKKKKIPKSPTDGTAIDIGEDDTEAFVSGLEENTTYYFVVFTNRTKSNAYKFKTGKNDAPEGIFKIQITTTQGIKDNGFKEVIEVTQV